MNCSKGVVSPTREFHPTYATGGYSYTSPVGSFAPNGYGLYDMAGNVFEWCWDRWSTSYYASSPGMDPRGPATGSGRVDRGGGWYSFAILCRSAYRGYSYPTSGFSLIGFRSVLPPGQ
jgi:formylglycine-generating enzyme